MSELDIIEVRGIDVVPHEYGIWCSIENWDGPFVNPIVSRKWSDDGSEIWIMLDTHNFDRFHPDDLVRVVRLPESRWRPKLTHGAGCVCGKCFARARPRPLSKRAQKVIKQLASLSESERARVLKLVQP